MTENMGFVIDASYEMALIASQEEIPDVKKIVECLFVLSDGKEIMTEEALIEGLNYGKYPYSVNGHIHNSPLEEIW